MTSAAFGSILANRYEITDKGEKVGGDSIVETRDMQNGMVHLTSLIQ